MMHNIFTQLKNTSLVFNIKMLAEKNTQKTSKG